MIGISPQCSGLSPLSGPLPLSHRDFITSKKQGKGTADLMMPFGAPGVMAGVLASLNVNEAR